jgi:predicted nucleic acid-binding protein
MIVVADASPVNYLIWIDEIAVLPKIYLTVLIPEAVRNELRRPAAPEAVRRWISSPSEWLEIRRPTRAPDAKLANLRIGPGERDAILLAEESGADELIADDRRGRKAAERRGIHIVGTLGVVQLAARRGLLDLRAALGRLRNTSFYVTGELIERLVAKTKT